MGITGRSQCDGRDGGGFQFPDPCCQQSHLVTIRTKMAVDGDNRQQYQLSRRSLIRVSSTVIGMLVDINLGREQLCTE